MQATHPTDTDADSTPPDHERGRGGRRWWQRAASLASGLAVVATLSGGALTAVGANSVAGYPAGDGEGAFYRTWERTERPVIENITRRTWIWGPEVYTPVIEEPYAEAPGGVRQVQYFDKSRMEITNPTGDQDSAWYVTNGLLVVEMMSGQMQVGDNEFIPKEPADIPLAGDPNDPDAPTYASFAPMRDLEPQGTLFYTRFLDAEGTLSVREDLSIHGMAPGPSVEVNGHTYTIPDRFWYFMTGDGAVYEDGEIVSDLLFENPYYATGLPITEPVWVNVKVGGTPRDVLVQCFERRCLTYEPLNQEGWNLEMGNVGLHYYTWRYGQNQPSQVVTSVATDPEVIRYAYDGNPPAETQDYGPTAIAAAGDGSFWIADSADVRLVHVDARGELLRHIDLAAQGAASVLDVDVYSGFVWAWWLNLDTGTYRVQGFTADGELVHDADLSAWAANEPSILSASLIGSDEGMVLQLDLGLRFVRVVSTAGEAEWTPIPRIKVGDHYYGIEHDSTDPTRATLIVHDKELPLQADAGAFTVQASIVAASGGSVWVTRYSVFGDGSITYAVERYSEHGTHLGSSTAPLSDAYAYVPSPYTALGSGLYMLQTDREALQIWSLSFGYEQ